jgi:hypothetical protein
VSAAQAQRGDAAASRSQRREHGPWRRRVAAAVLGLVVAFVAIALPVGLYSTVRRVLAAAGTVGVPPGPMRARVFGQRYAAAIAAIRRAIPEDEPYFIASRADGALVWVRYDLLPRRAVRFEALAANRNDCWLAQIRWSVTGLAFGHPPLLLERPVSRPPGCPPAPWLERR